MTTLPSRTRSHWYLIVQQCGGILTGEIPLGSEGGFGGWESTEDEGWYTDPQGILCQPTLLDT